MRATVTCTCGKPFEPELAAEATTLTELGAAATVLMIAAHTADHHGGHEVRLVLEPEPAAECELEIRCLYKNCGGDPPMHARVPACLVPAVVLVFHTAHEGHRLDVRYDDRHWVSPE